MRFDTEAYAKIFPRTEPTKKVDSAVENFPPEDDLPDEDEVEYEGEGGEE